MLRLFGLITGLIALLQIATAGGFSSSTATPLQAKFSTADRSAFETDRIIDGQECALVLLKFDHCFEPSPKEPMIARNNTVPNDLMEETAPWTVLVSLEPKKPHLRVIQVGRKLALVDERSGEVTDLMDFSDTE
jgi:hypothetical protein